ncbi:MAG TPA: alpha/beta hydrolase, partial [Rhodocyclaceae bacterium]|nr:alpha/beta hydrolase [Rhodocyclaceae bacterium]
MTHFIADDGEHIRVEISGDGPALILLHGWTTGHRDWSMFMPGLNPSFRVYRWDARCRGDAQPRTTTAPTVERMARDLHNLLDHFQLEQAIVVGHSMGALILWQYLQDFGTARVARLCFIDQSPKLVTDENWRLGIYGNFDHAHSRQFIERLRQDFPDTVLKLVAHGLNRRARADFEAGTPAWVAYRSQLEQFNPAPLIACWESLVAADYRAVLPQIDVPTLLIYGGESNFYVPETATYVAQAIP